MTFYFSLVLSVIVHVIMLSLFYVSAAEKLFYIPKMTRVSYMPIDMSQLSDYVEEDESLSEAGLDMKSIPIDLDGLSTGSSTSYWNFSDIEASIEVPDKDVKAQQKRGHVTAELRTQRKVVRLYYPVYPKWAKRAGLQSDVALRFQILKNGKVGQIMCEELSDSPELDVLALRAVRRWRFESLPDAVGGSDQWGSVTLKFRLQ